MGIYRVAIAAYAVVIASPALAQVSDESSPVELYTACMKAAIDAHEASLTPGYFISFACHGDIAQVFFEKLKSYDYQARDEKSAEGTVHMIAFDFPDACWQKIQNADGSPANEYGCSLNFHGSGALLSKKN